MVMKKLKLKFTFSEKLEHTFGTKGLLDTLKTQQPLRVLIPVKCVRNGLPCRESPDWGVFTGEHQECCRGERVPMQP